MERSSSYICNIWKRLVSPSHLTPTLVILSMFLLCWLFRCTRRRQLNQFGHMRWPLLGGLVELLGNFEHIHDWLMCNFEKSMTFSMPLPFSVKYVFTVDPANVEHILSTKFSNYPKGETIRTIFKDVLGEGIFNSDGELWRKHRKLIAADFNPKTLRGYSTDVFRDYALRLSCILATVSGSDACVVDMQDLFMRLTFDSVCQIGFGVQLGNLSPDFPEIPFAKAFDIANTAVSLRFLNPIWKLQRWLNVGSEAVIKECVRKIDEFTFAVIEARRGEISGHSKSQPQKTGRLDLLSKFLEQNGNCTTDKSLRDIVLNLMIAGRDATAVTLSWFVYMMTQHPKVEKKVYDELRSFENRNYSESELCRGQSESFDMRLSKFAELLTYEALGELHYLHAVVTETVRLFPALPLDPKGILTDDVLPDGTRLSRRDLISYSPYCMARMKRIWGHDAGEFQPERWLKDGVFQPVSPFKFASFQAGPRTCLGKDSAYLQLKMTTALLFRFFRFEVVSGHGVNYKTSAILTMEHGLKVAVTRLNE